MRIIWLKTELLHPVDRGGRIRSYAMLRALAKQHQITYVCLDDGTAPADAAERASEYCHHLVRIPFSAPQRRSLAFLFRVALNMFSADPFSAWRFRSEQMRAYLEGVGAQDADVVVCDFLFPAVNIPTRVALPVVLFQHNVEAVIWERMASTASSAASKAYYGLQARRLVRFEHDTCRDVDQVIAVSREDSEMMKARYGVERVGDVPTGVDTDFFSSPADRQPVPGRLVFMGAMDWLPNEDGMAFFFDRIWPLVRAKRPDTTLTIIGRNPSNALKARAGGSSGIEVTGTVDDVRPHLARGSVFIVPLRIGGGTRLKIFEAMSMGLPVVSTAIGAEGLPLVPGRDLLIADAAEDFAAAVLRLVDAPAEAKEIADCGAAKVRAQFGWDRAADRFTTLCEAAIAHQATHTHSARMNQA